MVTCTCDRHDRYVDCGRVERAHEVAWEAAISRSIACFKLTACSSVFTRILYDAGAPFSWPTNEIDVFAKEGLRPLNNLKLMRILPEELFRIRTRRALFSLCFFKRSIPMPRSFHSLLSSVLVNLKTLHLTACTVSSPSSPSPSSS